MPLPEIAESGYDWLFIDLEHSPMDARNALDILTAVVAKIPCVVRVPCTDYIMLARTAAEHLKAVR